MRRLWADHRAGTLTPIQAQYFSAPRPVSELYDVIADPYEVNNLAESPAHAADLRRLSTAMDEWIERVGDLSQISEKEMIETMWPGVSSSHRYALFLQPLKVSLFTVRLRAHPSATKCFQLNNLTTG